MTTVYYTDSTPGTAVSLLNETASLADWASRIQMTEGTGANTGRWSATVTTNGRYKVFEGVTQPSDWEDNVGTIVVDDSLNTLLDRTETGVTVTTYAPVADDGSLTEIIIGDDYLAANGRAFEWTVAAVDGVDRTTALCYFGGKTTIDGTEYEWLIDGTITLDGSDWKLSFDLTKTDTQNLPSGRYRWSVEVQSSTGTEITKVKNASNCLVRLVEKQT